MSKQSRHVRLLRTVACGAVVVALWTPALALAECKDHRPDDPTIRRALLIGNGTYDSTPNGLRRLTNPKNDVDKLKEELRRLGFFVRVCKELAHHEIIGKVQTFARETQPGDLLFFYFAGHGAYFPSEKDNVLFGVDHDRQSTQPGVVGLNKVIGFLGERQPSAAILAIDACRGIMPSERDLNNNLKNNEDGLLAAAGPLNVYIAFATAPNQPAYDGDTDSSPFAAALVAEMSKVLPRPTNDPSEKLDVDILFRLVRQAVIASTEPKGRKQIPWTNHNLTSSVYLVP